MKLNPSFLVNFTYNETERHIVISKMREDLGLPYLEQGDLVYFYYGTGLTNEGVIVGEGADKSVVAGAYLIENETSGVSYNNLSNADLLLSGEKYQLKAGKYYCWISKNNIILK